MDEYEVLEITPDGDVDLSLIFNPLTLELEYEVQIGTMGGSDEISPEKIQEMVAFLQRIQAKIRDREQEQN